jgi:hypothetical protein
MAQITKTNDENEERLLRRRKVSVRKAAALADVSEDSFRRHYGHLIRQITPRRQGVELGDALDLPPPPAP